MLFNYLQAVHCLFVIPYHAQCLYVLNLCLIRITVSLRV